MPVMGGRSGRGPSILLLLILASLTYLSNGASHHNRDNAEHMDPVDQKTFETIVVIILVTVLIFSTIVNALLCRAVLLMVLVLNADAAPTYRVTRLPTEVLNTDCVSNTIPCLDAFTVIGFCITGPTPLTNTMRYDVDHWVVVKQLHFPEWQVPPSIVKTPQMTSGAESSTNFWDAFGNEALLCSSGAALEEIVKELKTNLNELYPQDGEPTRQSHTL
uniref:Putative ORF8 protein n=1 Tax=Zaria bat coronavirus TaxID=989337 RepID=F1BYM5_9BETC|nr:putative ORF8 protein [Zaria bat coronavirus]